MYNDLLTNLNNEIKQMDELKPKLTSEEYEHYINEKYEKLNIKRVGVIGELSGVTDDQNLKKINFIDDMNKKLNIGGKAPPSPYVVTPGIRRRENRNRSDSTARKNMMSSIDQNNNVTKSSSSSDVGLDVEGDTLETDVMMLISKNESADEIQANNQTIRRKIRRSKSNN